MSNSAAASLPPEVRIANLPPGCKDKRLETFKIRPFRTTHTSPFLLCFATLFHGVNLLRRIIIFIVFILPSIPKCTDDCVGQERQLFTIHGRQERMARSVTQICKLA